MYTRFTMTLKWSEILERKAAKFDSQVKMVLKLFNSLEKPSKSQCRGCGTLHVPVSVRQSK